MSDQETDDAAVTELIQILGIDRPDAEALLLVRCAASSGALGMIPKVNGLL